ncbi:hypothetical protein [Spirillospora sp. NPDC047279]
MDQGGHDGEDVAEGDLDVALSGDRLTESELSPAMNAGFAAP